MRQGGEAVADVLFGDYNPTGRLAISIPRSSGQLPVYYNYKPSKEYWMKTGWSHNGGYVDMPGTPLWSFGYGLSYTEFQYSNLHIEPAQIPQGGMAKVTVDVRNTGPERGYGHCTDVPASKICGSFTPRPSASRLCARHP